MRRLSSTPKDQIFSRFEFFSKKLKNIGLAPLKNDAPLQGNLESIPYVFSSMSVILRSNQIVN